MVVGPQPHASVGSVRSSRIASTRIGLNGEYTPPDTPPPEMAT